MYDYFEFETTILQINRNQIDAKKQKIKRQIIIISEFIDALII